MRLPKHVFITSRAKARGNLKQKHYALVCKKKEEILEEHWKNLKLSQYKNINSNKNLIAHSQVTAILEPNGGSNGITTEYSIMFAADLVYPYFITLVNPVELPLALLKEMNVLIGSKKMKHEDWEKWAVNTSEII